MLNKQAPSTVITAVAAPGTEVLSDYEAVTSPLPWGLAPLTAAQGPIPATELVTAAVFSMGPEDGTKCWCCGLEPSRCAAGGHPTWGHRRPHSLCGHLRGQCPDRALSWGGRDHMDGQILGQLRPLAEEEEEDGAGDAPSTRPAFPGMGSEELRLASFCDWPLSAVVPPELLAAAGFFHTGESQGPGLGGR